MAIYEITAPNGEVYEITAPDDATEEQVLSYAQTQFATEQKTQPKQGMLDKFTDYAIGNTLGAVRGAADIGNTLINAATAIPRNLAQIPADMMGIENPLEKLNQSREAGLDEWTEQNKDRPGFGIGRLGANVAGTMGVPAALGGAVHGMSQAPRALQLAQALKTGGLGANAGGIGTRVAGGALTGGATAGLIDPESAGTGAVIGGALPMVPPVAKSIGRGLANVIGGVGTHTGGESLKQAASAGLRGGQAQQAFTENMRGNVPVDDVLSTAKSNLQNMFKQKAAEYRSGMAQVSNDKTVLSFDGIDDALDDAFKRTTYKGQVKDAEAAQTFQKIKEAVDEWKQLDPSEFHTPEGLDALKQKIYGIYGNLGFEKQSARGAGKVIHDAVKKEIQKQAPDYAKTMKAYSEASDQLSEIERALSLNPKASVDTGIRKLQSLMRNNANTNYGSRVDLAKALETQGGQEMMPALAGQALNTWTPRGLGAPMAGATGIAAIMNPQLAPALAFQSPRLMGEAALGVGRGSRALADALKTAPSIPAATVPSFRR
jgi:hypothetical protein